MEKKTRARIIVSGKVQGVYFRMETKKEAERLHVFGWVRNNKDGTVEGLKHRYLPVFSVQYHPEAAPGPKDSEYIFDQFMDMMTGKEA